MMEEEGGGRDNIDSDAAPRLFLAERAAAHLGGSSRDRGANGRCDKYCNFHAGLAARLG